MNVVGVVGNHDNGLAVVAHALEGVHEGTLGARVKTRRRFVEEEKRRVAHQLHRDGGALLLAAGELADQLILVLGQFHCAQHFLHAGFPLGERGAFRQTQTRRVAQHTDKREVLMHNILLRNIANVVFQFVVMVVEVMAVDQHLAGRGFVEAVDAVHQRGFARARTADNRHEIARFNQHTRIVQNLFVLPEGLFDKFGDVHQFQRHALVVALVIQHALGIGEFGDADQEDVLVVQLIALGKQRFAIDGNGAFLFRNKRMTVAFMVVNLRHHRLEFGVVQRDIRVLGAADGGHRLAEGVAVPVRAGILVRKDDGDAAVDRLGKIVDANGIAVLEFHLLDAMAVDEGAVGTLVVGEIAASVPHREMPVAARNNIRRDHDVVGIVAAEGDFLLAERHQVVLVGNVAVIKDRDGTALAAR